jgi:sensor domain CHASE-containing protein
MLVESLDERRHDSRALQVRGDDLVEWLLGTDEVSAELMLIRCHTAFTSSLEGKEDGAEIVGEAGDRRCAPAARRARGLESVEPDAIEVMVDGTKEDSTPLTSRVKTNPT